MLGHHMIIFLTKYGHSYFNLIKLKLDISHECLKMSIYILQLSKETVKVN